MMKNMGLRFGHVNLRFTCCTYMAFTKTTPSYCDKYEFSDGYLRSYCQKDYQKHRDEAAMYERGRRRLIDESITDSAQSNGTQNYEYLDEPTLLTINVASKDFQHEKMNGHSNNPYPNHLKKNEYQNMEFTNVHGDATHRIRIEFDSGEFKELFYRMKSSQIAVPPADLLDETFDDGFPSMVLESQSDLQIMIDGSRGSVTKVDIDTM